MSVRIVQNFRGMHAGILHPADRHRDVLAETLSKLGLTIAMMVPADMAAVSSPPPSATDVLFFDADAPDGLTIANCATDVPLVAIVGMETPSRLQRAFELAPSAILHKPLRPTGIYTALYFAVNEHHRRQALIARAAELQARHGARRFVIKAVLALTAQHGIDDDQAYRMLRRESMQQRLTVEELAVRMLAGGSLSAGRKVMRA